MKTIEELYKDLVEEWRSKARGLGMINFGVKVDYFPVVLGVLQEIYNAKPYAEVLIICKNDFIKQSFITYITHTNDDDNNKEFKKLIRDKNLIIKEFADVNTWTPQTKYHVSILMGIDRYGTTCGKMIRAGKFKLVCLTSYGTLRDCLQGTLYEFGKETIKEIEKTIMNTPVEEEQIAVDIPEEDTELLNKYNQCVADSIKIFGDFEMMQYAKNGNSQCNVTASEICYDIARNNGWNEHLDMSVEFNRQLDSLYNPNSLRERVDLTYEIIRKRNKLIRECRNKLQAIADIVRRHEKQKILIINYSAEFARQVTMFINDSFGYNVIGKRFYKYCYDYHNEVDKCQAIDEYGRVITVKSGKDKGKPRMLGAKSQMTMAQDYINKGYTYCISTNNSPEKSLACEFDVMIITSPFCELYDNYKYRLSNSSFVGSPFKVYKIYCNGTNEEKELQKQKVSEIYSIVNNSKKSVKYDENLGVILA